MAFHPSTALFDPEPLPPNPRQEGDPHFITRGAAVPGLGAGYNVNYSGGPIEEFLLPGAYDAPINAQNTLVADLMREIQSGYGDRVRALSGVGEGLQRMAAREGRGGGGVFGGGTDTSALQDSLRGLSARSVGSAKLAEPERLNGLLANMLAMYAGGGGLASMYMNADAARRHIYNQFVEAQRGAKKQALSNIPLAGQFYSGFI